MLSSSANCFSDFIQYPSSATDWIPANGWEEQLEEVNPFSPFDDLHPMQSTQQTFDLQHTDRYCSQQQTTDCYYSPFGVSTTGFTSSLCRSVHDYSPETAVSQCRLRGAEAVNDGSTCSLRGFQTGYLNNGFCNYHYSGVFNGQPGVCLIFSCYHYAIYRVVIVMYLSLQFVRQFCTQLT